MLWHIDGADMLGFGPADDEIARLNAANGVVERSLADVLPKYNPAQRVTLPTSAQRLGAMYGVYQDKKDFSDAVLEVTPAVMALAHAEIIETGLRISPGDTRFGEASRRGTDPRALDCYGHRGIVFPANEYTKFPHKPPAVVDRVVERTRGANLHETDRIVADGKEYRVGAHVLARYLAAMHNQLLPAYSRDINALDLVLVATTRRANERFIGFSAEYLDVQRKIADRAIHATVEVACHFLSVGDVDNDPQARLALHRAVTSRLYHSDSPDRIAGSWQELAAMAKKYLEEKQGVVEQACLATVRALGRYGTAIPVDQKQ